MDRAAIERGLGMVVVFACSLVAFGEIGAVVGAAVVIAWWVLPPAYAVAIGAALGGIAGAASLDPWAMVWLGTGLAVLLAVEVLQEYRDGVPIAVFALLAAGFTGLAWLVAAPWGLPIGGALLAGTVALVGYGLHRYEQVYVHAVRGADGG